MSWSGSVASSSGSRRPRQLDRMLFARTHKAALEERLVRRREDERVRGEFWSGAVNYFDKMERANGRFATWTSDQSHKTSMSSYNKEREKELRKANLESRRVRLKKLLTEEAEEHREEMRRLAASGAARVGTGQQKEGAMTVEGLRAKREALAEARRAEQQKEADEKMLQHWKLNNPDFRQIQLRKHQEIVQKAWDAQRVERDAERERQKEEDAKEERAKGAAAAEREREIAEVEEKKRRKVMEWKKTLLEQIEAVRGKERSETAMKERMRTLLLDQKKIEEIEEKRKKAEERRKKVDLGNYLQRQHRLKLLAKNTQVQKELEEDRRILEELEKIREAKEEHDERRREDKRNEIQWMKKVLEDQKTEESRRGKMMENMFSSEAEGFWAKQDKTWREEKAARNKLMDDVVSGWKDQVRERLHESRDKSEELSFDRQRLEREMEKLNGDIAEEEAKREEQRVRFVAGIKAQVAEKGKLEEEGRAALMSRDDFMRQTNEMAQRLKNWDWDTAPEIGDFRRRRAKWF